MSVFDKSLKVVSAALEELASDVPRAKIELIAESMTTALDCVQKSAFSAGFEEGYTEGFMDGDAGGPTQ